MLISEINIKLTILGYWGVGKTSIVNSFVGKGFPSMYIPTIGSNIVRKEYKLKDTYVRLNIWDIGGQRSFNPLNPVYFSNLDAAFLVFDLSNPKETLVELKRSYIKNLKDNSPDCLTFLVGNKSDLVKPEDSEIIINSIRQSGISEFPLSFISAKSEYNLSEAFQSIVYKFLENLEENSNSRQIQGIASNFLDLVDKNEADLEENFFNLDNINSEILEKKITPTIIRKVVKDIDENFLPIQEISSFKDLKQTSVDLTLMKDNIIETFRNNLSIIEDIVLKLKNTPINLLIKTIDKTIEDLNYIKNDFELKLDSILDMESKNIQKI
jgi:small GTP-binding protein